MTIAIEKGLIDLLCRYLVPSQAQRKDPIDYDIDFLPYDQRVNRHWMNSHETQEFI
jgi:hypothetical protein